MDTHQVLRMRGKGFRSTRTRRTSVERSSRKSNASCTRASSLRESRKCNKRLADVPMYVTVHHSGWWTMMFHFFHQTRTICPAKDPIFLVLGTGTFIRVRFFLWETSWGNHWCFANSREIMKIRGKLWNKKMVMIFSSDNSNDLFLLWAKVVIDVLWNCSWSMRIIEGISWAMSRRRDSCFANFDGIKY